MENKNANQNPCSGCVYFAACGTYSRSRIAPCNGKAKKEKKDKETQIISI